MKTYVLVLVLSAIACTDAKTVVDPDATAIEVVTQIAAGDSVTQLRLSGTTGVSTTFGPSAVPELPRALEGEQTAVVLVADNLDGMEVLVRVDALAGGVVVRTGVAPVTVRAHATRRLDVALGEPAVCGDSKLRAPFETCDDGNTAAGDGCSTSCVVDPGWICSGGPSLCRRFTTSKEITAYAFGSINNPGLAADVQATITGTAISVTVPNGTNVAALVATFATTGASVTVSGTSQLSGATGNNFGSPVIYRVTAEDGSTKDYTVTVAVASGSAKDLTSFELLSVDNPGLGADVTGTIAGSVITLTVPSGTNTTALVATFSTTGASVRVGGTAQASGTTANDFTNPVTYRVTAADASTKDYTVTVTVAAGSAKDLTTFVFLSVDNPGLGADVTGTITGTAITLTVPSGTNITALVATFATNGASVRIGGTTQVSGTTVNNFTTSVIYRVTAADASTKDYVVTLTVAPDTAKAITAYALLTVDNPGLGADVMATIIGATISMTVPYGTNVAALVATFSTTGASVKVAGTAQTSGTTANNFINPVTYRVTAADASTKDYAVTITVASMTDKDLTSFAFQSVRNQNLWTEVRGTITGTTIFLTVPNGTDVRILVATFATTGASVRVVGTVQTSGTTANDFTNPVIYRVTAADGSTKDYTVTVREASSTEKELTAFTFLSVNNPGLAADVTGTITGTSIAVVVPIGTNITALVATFSTTGADVRVAGMTQVTGTTANDFTITVTYTVTAEDGSTRDFTVTVTFA